MLHIYPPYSPLAELYLISEIQMQFFLYDVFHVFNRTFFGVPKTWQILKMVSISLEPGKRGLRVYSSAMMQPTAHWSMGEL